MLKLLFCISFYGWANISIIFLSLTLFWADTHFVEMQTASADPVQMQNVASDQGQLCLLTGMSMQIQ